MSARFPKLAIATSVVNRILNVHAEIQAGKAQRTAAAAADEPTVPDTSETGPALNAKLYAPPAPVDAEPELADAVTLKGLV